MAKHRCAKLTQESSNGRDGFRLRFYDSQDKRRAIWLGKLTDDEAQVWLKHVEHLADCGRLNDPPSPVTTRWVAGLSLRNRSKLERVGLIAANEGSKVAAQKKNNTAPDRLGAYLDWYIKNRTGKTRTIRKWQQGRDCLLRFFGANRKLDSITIEDAEAWRSWLAKHGNIREGKERTNKNGETVRGRTDLAEATVRRRTGQARQFFSKAVLCKLIESNPFSGLAATVHGNDDRKFFVTHDMIELIIDNAPSLQWQCILALSRYGGLRAPSDVMRLRWEDLNFEARRMRIQSPKTEHHSNQGIRYSPIFPELLPFLEDLAELAKHQGAKPTDFVITKPRGSESVLRSTMLAILRKAGIEVYPKLFQNLRASRETELLDEFPIKDVCSWLGNSPKIAMEHYAMMRQESFARAAGLAEIGGPNGGPKTGDSRQSPATVESDDQAAEPRFYEEKQRENALLAIAGDSGQNRSNRPGRT